MRPAWNGWVCTMQDPAWTRRRAAEVGQALDAAMRPLWDRHGAAFANHCRARAMRPTLPAWYRFLVAERNCPACRPYWPAPSWAESRPAREVWFARLPRWLGAGHDPYGDHARREVREALQDHAQPEGTDWGWNRV